MNASADELVPGMCQSSEVHFPRQEPNLPRLLLDAVRASIKNYLYVGPNGSRYFKILGIQLGLV